MRSKSLTPLGETEMEILHLLWEMKRATVTDVQKRLLKRRKVAYTTVQTVLRNLSRKGYLTYEKDGATHVFAPARPADEVRHSLLKSLLTKVFNDSPAAMVQALVTFEDMSDDEIDELRRMIELMEAPDDDLP
jgi:predicted transcriptional regulator